MAVKIRLARMGTTKRPFYRIVACDSRVARNGKAIEILGTYDPMNLSVPKTSDQKQERGIIQVKTDRLKYWMSVGAQTSPSVKTILKRLKLSDKAA